MLTIQKPQLLTSLKNTFYTNIILGFQRSAGFMRIEDLSNVLMLLHDCLLSLCDFLSIDKFSKNAFQLRIGKNSTTHLYNDAIKRENFFEKKKKIVKITK